MEEQQKHGVIEVIDDDLEASYDFSGGMAVLRHNGQELRCHRDDLQPAADGLNVMAKFPIGDVRVRGAWQHVRDASNQLGHYHHHPQSVAPKVTYAQPTR